MTLRLLACLVFALGLGGLAACDRNEGPAEELEEAGQAIEDTAEDAGDKLEDAGDEIEDAADEAT